MSDNRYSKVNRDLQNFNGLYVPNATVYVSRNSLLNVLSETTGSTYFSVGCSAVRLRRVEIFHSGSADTFDVIIESKSPNTGVDFDPRDIITAYYDISGSIDFTGGIDQIEDIIAVTDDDGKIYIKIIPHGSGSNDFKYVFYSEAVSVYM